MLEVGDLVMVRRGTKCYADFAAFKAYRELFDRNAYGIIIDRRIETNGFCRLDILFYDGVREIDLDSIDLIERP